MKRFILALALMGLCLFASPAVSADVFTNGNAGLDCSGAASKSAVCTDHNQTTNPLTGPNGTLRKITDIVSYLAGAIAIIVILVAAFRFTTSGSDISTNSRTDTDVEKARDTLSGAVIGLIIIVLSRTLIVYILNKLS